MLAVSPAWPHLGDGVADVEGNVEGRDPAEPDRNLMSDHTIYSFEPEACDEVNRWIAESRADASDRKPSVAPGRRLGARFPDAGATLTQPSVQNHLPELIEYLHRKAEEEPLIGRPPAYVL